MSPIIQQIFRTLYLGPLFKLDRVYRTAIVSFQWAIARIPGES